MEKSQLIADLQQAAAKSQHAVVEMLAINAIENYPNEAFGYYYQAVCRVQRGNYLEAAESLQEVEKYDNGHIGAVLLGADIAREQGEIEQWAEKVNRALALDPLNAEVQLQAARYDVYQFENESALSYINNAILKLNNEAAYKVRAEIYQNTAQYELALLDLTSCQRFSPNNPLIIRQKIAINKLLADQAAVESEYRLLIALDDNNLDYKADFAYFLTEAGLYKDAEFYWDILVAYRPNEADYSLKRAAVRYKLEKYTDALEDCSTALMLSPKNADTYILLAKIRLAMYDIQEAIEELDNGINAEADDLAKLHNYKGEILMNKSDYIRAAEEFVIAAQSDTYEATACFNLGKCYMEQGELEKAYEAWQKAEAAFHPDADEMIQTYCSAQVAAQAQSTEAGLLFMYETEAENNRNSRFIKMLTGKVWKFSEEITVKSNPLFKEIPQEMSELLLDAFNKMVLFINPNGLFIMNPEQNDLRTVYRIDKEEANEIWLMCQPLTGSKERLFKLKYENKAVSLDGFAEDMEFGLYFRPAENGLSAKEKQAYQQRVENAEIAFMNM
jgi:tetratricopeptide (TPR) repeat protein